MTLSATTDPDTAEAQRAHRPGLLALLMLALVGVELLHLFSGIAAVRWGSHGMLLTVILVARSRLGVRECYLLTLSATITVAVWQTSPDPVRVLRLALDQAVFLMAFILAIGLLQEGAMTSPAVATVGRWLSRQPGGRRFLALFAGANTMAVVFNLGTVSLLAPLIRKAAAEAPDDPLTPVRERRQLSALLRGFAWGVVWSPTAVAPLALMDLIPGIDRLAWMAMGLAMTILMMAVGWAEDQITWRAAQRAAALRGRPAPPPFPGTALATFTGICAAYGVIVGSLMMLAGVSVVAGLMGAAPVLLVVWLVLQAEGRVRPALLRVRAIVQGALPRAAPGAVTLACSGFVGRAGAALVPAAEIAEALGFETLPDWIFLSGLAIAVALLSQLALSPIMMAVFFGALLGALPVLPADPTLTALALSAGWALSMTCSPFASIVIMLTTFTGHSGARLTWMWNTPFTIAALCALIFALWIATGGT